MSENADVLTGNVSETMQEGDVHKPEDSSAVINALKPNDSQTQPSKPSVNSATNSSSADNLSNLNDSPKTKNPTDDVAVDSAEPSEMPDSVSPGSVPTDEGLNPETENDSRVRTTEGNGPKEETQKSDPASSSDSADCSTSASSCSASSKPAGSSEVPAQTSPDQATPSPTDPTQQSRAPASPASGNPPPSDPIPNSEYNLRVDIDGAAAKDTNCASGSNQGNQSILSNQGSSHGNQAIPGATNSAASPQQSVYHVKWVKFKGSLLPIITQNENGPCPLLAIVNVLLLQGKVKLPAMMEMVTSGQLMEYLGDCIFENAPKNISEDAQLNYEQNMHDAMAVFHKLQTGLDVNVKFSSVSDFEYTPECIVFDLLGIRLYHGWLVDPEAATEVSAIGQCSYNQLVEKIIMNKNSNKEEVLTEALIAEEFINRTAAQLTYHGLLELATTVSDGQLCAFFRNNHFSTLYKHKDELFLLVTDQGFLTEPNVVWETLSNVEGDGHFVDGDFHTYRKPEPSTHPIPTPSVPLGTDQQVDQDYLVALTMQQEQQMAEQGSCAGAPVPNPAQDWGTAQAALSDHELAMRLQEEENRRAQQMAPQGQRSNSQSNGGNRERKKSSDCSIL